MSHCMTELAAVIGTHVLLEPVRGLQVECLVLNAKNSYGHQRIEIAPVAGAGSAWVNAARVQSGCTVPTVADPQKPEGR